MCTHSRYGLYSFLHCHYGKIRFKPIARKRIPDKVERIIKDNAKKDFFEISKGEGLKDQHIEEVAKLEFTLIKIEDLKKKIYLSKSEVAFLQKA